MQQPLQRSALGTAACAYTALRTCAGAEAGAASAAAGANADVFLRRKRGTPMLPRSGHSLVKCAPSALQILHRWPRSDIARIYLL
jgi:hypothetical protein